MCFQVPFATLQQRLDEMEELRAQLESLQRESVDGEARKDAKSG